MVKTFRKLAALTAAVALVASFAVCASAEVTVNTTTAYVDADTVSVSATVTGTEGELADGVQVTYYATNAKADATATAGIVHIDQAPATNGSAVFNFKTDADYLSSSVKVSYTGANAAVGSIIPGIFNLTVTDGTANVVSTPIAEGTDPNKTYTAAYTPAEGKYVSALAVTGGTATIVKASAGSLTFTLSGLPAVAGDIVITVTEADIAATDNESGRVVNAGGIIAKGASTDAKLEDGNADAYENFKAAAGNRKLTVIGQVDAAATEYGVIVAENIDDTVYTLPSERVYAAKGKGADGYFAVQLIDTENDLDVASFIVPGVTYETAVYYKTGNVYKIVKGESVTIPVEQ